MCCDLIFIIMILFFLYLVIYICGLAMLQKKKKNFNIVDVGTKYSIEVIQTNC